MLALSGAKTEQHGFSGWMGRLDIRVKILTLFTLSISLIFLNNPSGMAFLGSLSTCCLVSLGRYRMIVLIDLLLLATWLFSLGFSWMLGLIFPTMQEQTITRTLIPFLRMWPLVNTALAISLSMEIGQALLSLKKMHLPRIIYLPVMVALRFIPGFINDARQLRECLLIRGLPVNFAALALAPHRTLRLLIVPMVIRALRLADELAIAAELKRVGYGHGIRGRNLCFRWRDSTFFAAALLALIIAWNIPGNQVESGMNHAIQSSSGHTGDESANKQ